MSTDNNDTPESIENEEAIEVGADTGAEEATEGDSLEALQEELAVAKDAALRAQADAVNIQRRAEMDVEKPVSLPWSVSHPICCQSSTTSSGRLRHRVVPRHTTQWSRVSSSL